MFMIRRNPFSNFDLRFISPHLDADLFENNTHTSSEKVINNANEWKVLLTVPGVDPSELDISVENNVLKVNYTSTNEEAFFSTKSFTRRWTLDSGVDQDAISAELKNGILAITVPKPQLQMKKQVPIQIQQ